MEEREGRGEGGQPWVLTSEDCVKRLFNILTQPYNVGTKAIAAMYN